MNQSPSDESAPLTVWRGLLLVEFTALLIALASTVVPTKTGSKTGISGFFFENPTFVQEFLINLVGVHLMMGVLALGLFLWVRLSSSSRSEAPVEMKSRLLPTNLVATAAFMMIAGCQPNCSDLVFPPPEDSPYLLPYPIGESYVVSQTICNPRGGHRNRIAVDFMMPMGAVITAARSGEVIHVVEHYEDGDLRRGRNNRVLIRHDDGSVAWYAHLQQHSASVSQGEVVAVGRPIARCGNTGNTGNLPHLHFEVFREKPFVYADAIPVSFRNADGPLQDDGGLMVGVSYKALE